MGSQLEFKIGAISLDDETKYERTAFGKDMLKHFLFDPDFKNLNHGSFGAFPRAIRDKQREYMDACEAAPDPFIRYTYPRHLIHSREALAGLLNCPASTIVLVPNATTGVNTILRNLVWNVNGKDEIIYFKTIYGGCQKTVEYVCELNNEVVKGREVVVNYPIDDSDLLALFKDTIEASRADGKIPRVAIFDTVSSNPGLRVPFESLTAICKEEGILSLIDAAHGIGHVHIDLSTLDPDFFVSNAHKWLFVPRGCAVLYVAQRNQHLIRSPLPTSHGFIPKTGGDESNPFPPNSETEFVNNFTFIGTIDYTNYMVVNESIKWREQVCGGEKAIIEYNSKLAREGGKAAANILGTKILDNAKESLTDCCLVMILLPLIASSSEVDGTNVIKPEHARFVAQWIQEVLIKEYKAFIAVYKFQGQWWARLSGQVYLEMSDFEWAGRALKEVCERAGREEFTKAAQEFNTKNK